MQSENNVPVPSEVLEIAREVLTTLAENIDSPQGQCFMCKAPVTHKEQIGQCVYMRPCGHSYQGQLKKAKRRR